MSGEGVRWDGSSLLRPWRSGDERLIDGLIGPSSDPLWVSQYHALHGPEVDDARWSRTIVATNIHGHLVGAATIAVNPIHPGRYESAVEVHRDARRCGLGSHLVHALHALRLEQLPLSTKLRSRDSCAASFVAKFGGRNYQRCPCTTVDPREQAVTSWCARNSPPAESVVGDLHGFSNTDLIDALARQYVWVHEQWSPVGDLGALREAIGRMLLSVDRGVSSVVSIDRKMCALSLAFIDGTRCEVVAETVEADQYNGRQLVAACVARTIGSAAASGLASVEFDGHESDPNLYPVTQSIPGRSDDPLNLVEVP